MARFVLCWFLMVGCNKTGGFDPGLVHRDLLVVDTHIDVPYRLGEKPADISQRLNDGHFDFVRAQEGGLDASFFSIFIESRFNRVGTSPDAKGGAFAEVQKVLARTEAVLVQNRDRARRVETPDELESVVASGKHAVVYGLENGAPIEGDLNKLKELHRAGIRYVTLTHAKDNHICDSSYDTRHSHRGLTEFGRRLIPEMNRLGMLIDVSHVSDDAFWQVLELSATPLIASHSGLRRFHAMERNVSDDMAVALAKAGGVLQLNFGTYFLSGEVAKKMKALNAEIKRAKKSAATPEAAGRRVAELEAAFAAEHNVELQDLIDQLDYAIKLMGEDHVGFGSDFDGVRLLPRGLEDVSRYPAITAALLARGYTPATLRKIAGGNLLRVWRDNLKKSAALAKPGR